ncbi:uncharacterized protein LOC109821541 [Asparagus officinalis]|uniref:uncharacterized protein LOC109821541 n=1 Tax=Asparagus officinalis TaxID=4686 RepID=UPI00098E7716|nr:uncharacterized protein LOC109821541 [Asparagus officinalis]
MAADAESAPVMDLPKSPALEPGGLEENPSPSPSALMSQAGDLIPSPITGLMNKPAAGTDLLKPSAAQDDEERVDYEGSSIGGAADEDRDDEDADVGNMPDDGEDDEEHDSIDDITTFDDAPKVPSDKASGYTPFYLTGKLCLFRLLPHAFSVFRPFFRAGSPTPGTTSAAPLEQAPAPAPTPLPEQHLPGSSTATVSPATVVTPPLEQQLVPVSAPAQEQPLPASSTVAVSPTALLKISLTSTEARPTTSQARAMMALTSSPSQLNVSTASAASAPGSPAPISMARGASSAVVSSLADTPEFLQISLVYLNSLAKTVVEYMVNGRGTLNSFRPLLEAGLNGVRSVGNTQWFERCSEIILRFEEQL